MPYIERLAAICSNIGCGFKTNELLKSHTTFKIGGICKCFIDVNNAESLQKILYFLKQENVSYFVMGRGSNILASDEGYDGGILHIGKFKYRNHQRHRYQMYGRSCFEGYMPFCNGKFPNRA